MLVYVYQRAQAGVRMYIIMSYSQRDRHPRLHAASSYNIPCQFAPMASSCFYVWHPLEAPECQTTSFAQDSSRSDIASSLADVQGTLGVPPLAA